MSRSNYSDDYGDDFPGQIDLYRANVERSIRSKAGQARLRELRDALLALPVKQLQAEIFAEADPAGRPQVCALGAWALAKCGGNIEQARAMVPFFNSDDQGMADALAAHKWPRLVVLDTIFVNDESASFVKSAEQRYAFVLAWVESHIA